MLSKPYMSEVELSFVWFLLNRVLVSSASSQPLCLLTKASFIITWKIYSLGYVIFGGDFSALDVLFGKDKKKFAPIESGNVGRNIFLHRSRIVMNCSSS